MPEIDWIIHIVANGMRSEDCGKIENPFPQYICNAHTHGMERYGHQDFQLVIHMAPQDMGYVLIPWACVSRQGRASKQEIWWRESSWIARSDLTSLKRLAGRSCV